MKLIFSALVIFAWIQVLVNARSVMRTLSFQGLPANPARPWITGGFVAFNVKWIDQPGFFVKKELHDWRFTLVRNSVLNELTRLGQKTVIRKVEYGAPNAEGWFKVTFFLPKELKSGKYYLLWETKFLRVNQARSEDFYITSSQTFSSSPTPLPETPVQITPISSNASQVPATPPPASSPPATAPPTAPVPAPVAPPPSQTVPAPVASAT